MQKHRSLIAAAIVAAMAVPAAAQQPAASGYEKKEFTHSAWTKGIFSEAVTVKGFGAVTSSSSPAWARKTRTVRAATSATTAILSRNVNTHSTRSSVFWLRTARACIMSPSHLLRLRT